MGEENVLRPELPINNIAGNSSWKWWWADLTWLTLFVTLRYLLGVWMTIIYRLDDLIWFDYHRSWFGIFKMFLSEPCQLSYGILVSIGCIIIICIVTVTAFAYLWLQEIIMAFIFNLLLATVE
jgi:hypothetical protein